MDKFKMIPRGFFILFFITIVFCITLAEKYELLKNIFALAGVVSFSDFFGHKVINRLYRSEIKDFVEEAKDGPEK